MQVKIDDRFVYVLSGEICEIYAIKDLIDGGRLITLKCGETTIDVPEHGFKLSVSRGVFLRKKSPKIKLISKRRLR